MELAGTDNGCQLPVFLQGKPYPVVFTFRLKEFPLKV
jgi:hypothetical protein